MFLDHFTGFFRHLKHSGLLWKDFLFNGKTIEPSFLIITAKFAPGNQESNPGEGNRPGAFPEWTKPIEFISTVSFARRRVTPSLNFLRNPADK
jgi:hypothetical protein